MKPTRVTLVKGGSDNSWHDGIERERAIPRKRRYKGEIWMLSFFCSVVLGGGEAMVDRGEGGLGFSTSGKKSYKVQKPPRKTTW